MLDDAGAIAVICKPVDNPTYITRTVRFSAPGNVRGNLFCRGRGTTDHPPPRMGAVILEDDEIHTFDQLRPLAIMENIITIINRRRPTNVHIY